MKAKLIDDYGWDDETRIIDIDDLEEIFVKFFNRIGESTCQIELIEDDIRHVIKFISVVTSILIKKKYMSLDDMSEYFRFGRYKIEEE